MMILLEKVLFENKKKLQASWKEACRGIEQLAATTVGGSTAAARGCFFAATAAIKVYERFHGYSPK
jgi:hypothetical protein